MRHTTVPLCVVALLLMVAPIAGADDAKEVFDSLYATKIRRAIGSVGREDDLALAKELFQAAQDSTQTHDLLALLCDAAYDLGQRHPDGAGISADAMKLLADTVEEKRHVARENLIDLLTKQARTGKPEERDAATEELVDLLLVMADEQLAERNWKEASARYRRAMLIAAPRKLPQWEVAKAGYEHASRFDNAIERIATLAEQLLLKANATQTAKEIVMLYVTVLDEPEKAVRYLNRTKDETLEKMVPLAADPSSIANDADRLALGQWYRSLAGTKPEAAELPMLRHATDHLAAYLRSTSSEGLDRAKAELLQKEIETLIEKIESDAGPRVAAGGPAKWTSVMDWIDPEKEKRKGTWTSEKEGIALKPTGGWNFLNTPITVTGDYDVRWQLTPTQNNDCFIIQLPVQSRFVDVVLSARSGEFHTIRRFRADDKQKPDWWTPGALTPGKRAIAVIQVRQKDKQVTLTLTLNGKRIGGWTESIDNIETHLHWHNFSPATINFGTWETGMIINRLDVLPVRGELKKAERK